MIRIKEIIIKNKKEILLIAFAVIFLIYLIKPICFDVKLYIEAAYRADSLGSFPNNIVEAWEHKYLLNRLLYYIMFVIASIFVSPTNVVLFEFVIKVIYGIIALGIIYYFSKSTKHFFEKYNISQGVVFGILYTIIFLAGIYFSMQTEMTAFLVLLIAISFILKDKLKYHILSAFIISLLFWFKGATLLYSVVVLAVMLINNFKISRIALVIACSCAFLGIELLAIYLIYPNEITNMYLATQYLTSIPYEIYERDYIDFILSYINVGIIFFVFNISKHIKYKNIKLLLIESMIWFFLIAGVIIQKSVFEYILGLIVPAILFSIFVCIDYIKNKGEKLNNTTKIIAIIIACITILCFVQFEVSTSMKIHEQTLNASNKVEILKEQIPDLKEEEVLYIGNGLSSYYIKSKSYLNYVTTIFFGNENNVYLQSEYVNKLKEQVLNYTGKYIVIDYLEMYSKFRVSDDILKFIEENYHYKQCTNISIGEVESIVCSVIYERNE